MEPNSVAMRATQAPGAGVDGGQLKIDIKALEHADNETFREALARHTQAGAVDAPGKNGQSLGHMVAERATGLASEMQKDQQYVSKLLEQATRTGDDLHMMRAMMALSDYQMRVQTISKTVSKATSSIDSLTKLQ